MNVACPGRPPLMAQIEHISDTARWVAVYRAMETERPDAIFRDPFARRLAGAQGEAIVQRRPQGRTWAWPMIVRTAGFDQVILRTVTTHGGGTVLNLAGAPFQFAPQESSRFFEPHGWQEREWRSIWEESLRLKRTMRLAWLWNFVGKFYPKRTREEFKRFSGVALLESRR